MKARPIVRSIRMTDVGMSDGIMHNDINDAWCREGGNACHIIETEILVS